MFQYFCLYQPPPPLESELPGNGLDDDNWWGGLWGGLDNLGDGINGWFNVDEGDMSYRRR